MFPVGKNVNSFSVGEHFARVGVESENDAWDENAGGTLFDPAQNGLMADVHSVEVTDGDGGTSGQERGQRASGPQVFTFKYLHGPGFLPGPLDMGGFKLDTRFSMGSILRRYILREVAAPFGLALLVLVTLLVLQKIIQITDWVVNCGVGLLDMLSLIGLILPYFLVLIIPMALLFATLLAVNRLSADSEITAMKAGGIGIGGLFPPVFALGVLCTALTGFLNLYLVPRAMVWSEKLMFDIARTSARAAVRVKSFRDITPGVTIYVDAIREDVLEGVLISELEGHKIGPSDTGAIFVAAREGRLVSNAADLTNYFLLTDGSIHTTDREGKVYRKIDFGRYDFKISIKQEKEKGIEKGSQFEVMDLPTLRHKRAEYLREFNQASAKKDEASIQKARSYSIALAQIGISYHQKFSLPFACLILALWGIPLGIQPPRSTRHQGVVTSIVLSVIYYLLVSGGKIMATRFVIGPAVAVWMPNAVVLASGLEFLRRAARDRPLPLAKIVENITGFFSRIISRARLRNAL